MRQRKRMIYIQIFICTCPRTSETSVEGGRAGAIAGDALPARGKEDAALRKRCLHK